MSAVSMAVIADAYGLTADFGIKPGLPEPSQENGTRIARTCMEIEFESCKQNFQTRDFATAPGS